MQVMEAVDVIGNDKVVGVYGWGGRGLAHAVLCVTDILRNSDGVWVGLCAGKGVCIFNCVCARVCRSRRNT